MMTKSMLLFQKKKSVPTYGLTGLLRKRVELWAQRASVSGALEISHPSTKFRMHRKIIEVSNDSAYIYS